MKAKKHLLLLLVGWAGLVSAQHNPSGVASGSSAVSVAGADYKEPREQSGNPFINKVYEYCPAPGQFINMMPESDEDDTRDSLTSKANDCLVNNQQEMVCLGGFGGYIVFGFDHPVVNVRGEYDFQIDGNAFYSNANPNDDAPKGGSSEPGIVMVSCDDNGNGLPDDQWYELAGSEYYDDQTVYGYKITYFRPAPDHVATPNKSYPVQNDTTYIRWTANDGTSGYISKNVYHSQNYFPDWIEEDSITFVGTKIRNNAIDESGKGTYYVLYCFDWGYVDDHPNNTDMGKFNIDWAVDAEGVPVELDQIDFVRVHTAVNQYAGWLGETSTEILNAYDLHPDEEPAGISEIQQSTPNGQSSNLKIQSSKFYDLSGRKITTDAALHGFYISTVNGKTTKIYKR